MPPTEGVFFRPLEEGRMLLKFAVKLAWPDSLSQRDRGKVVLRAYLRHFLGILGPQHENECAQ
jgi:hypothetical protein